MTKIDLLTSTKHIETTITREDLRREMRALRDDLAEHKKFMEEHLTKRTSPIKPNEATVRWALVRLGKKGSGPIGGFLKLKAEQYCKENNLDTRKGGGEHRNNTYFPNKALEWAMEEYKKQFDAK